MNYVGPKPGDAAKIAAALDTLSDLPFPPFYLLDMREEMVAMLNATARQKTYVYLAFFGHGDKATFLKIGVAGNVRKRMGALGGASPTPRLWLYTAAYPTKADALLVEKALLKNMEEHRVHGEWVDLGGGVSEVAAMAIAHSLEEVARHTHPDVQFHQSGL